MEVGERLLEVGVGTCGWSCEFIGDENGAEQHKVDEHDEHGGWNGPESEHGGEYFRDSQPHRRRRRRW